MKLVVISSSHSIENETKIVTRLFEAGLETFHLRKHRFSTWEMRSYLNEIPNHFHNRIIIHSHHNLVGKFKLKGIHLTKSHKQRKLNTWILIKLIRIKNPDTQITTSFNTIGHLLEPHQKYNYNYVFLSPIFDSSTSRFQGGFTEYSLKSALQKTQYNIIARGGVDIESIEKANAIGFKGLAFYSSLWKSPDPLETFNRIIEKFQELKIPIE